MESIAIISDIHGNLEALNEVLKDIKEKNIEKIYCIGDIIAKGTHQKECLDLVRKHCEVVVKGNCDEHFAKDLDILDYPEIEQRRIIWNKSKLDGESIQYLRGLPYCYEFYMSGRLIRLFHASPSKINDYISGIDGIDRLFSLFLPSDKTLSDLKADVVVYGHTHTQYIQKIYNRTIINAGSIGNALDVIRDENKDGDVRNTALANYVIISGELDCKDMTNKISYELVNVPYDLDNELLSNTDNIEFDAYSKEIKEGKYRDMERIYKAFKLNK